MFAKDNYSNLVCQSVSNEVRIDFKVIKPFIF
jgi:hypothetical protein